MSDSRPIPNIFLSYCWKDKEFADQIDNDFKAIGITFIRDQRNIDYKGDIKEFMHRIGKSDFIIMIISDDYLRRPNCMYEVTELLNSHEFEKRILPVLLPSAKIFDPEDRKAYYNYWKAEIGKAEVRLHENITSEDYQEERKRVANIYSCLGEFFNKVKYLKHENFDSLKKENYKSILDIIGINENHLLDQLIAIQQIDNKENQELELEKFLRQHPNNPYVLFTKGFWETEYRKFGKAVFYFSVAISNKMDFAAAYYNRGVLYQQRFNDKDKALSDYIKAIELEPEMADAYNNRGNLYIVEFDNRDKALADYNKVIELRPDAMAYFNRGFLLHNKFNDKVGGLESYNKSIELAPNADAFINRGVLLISEFNNTRDALLDYKRAIELDSLQRTSERDHLFGLKSV